MECRTPLYTIEVLPGPSNQQQQQQHSSNNNHHSTQLGRSGWSSARPGAAARAHYYGGFDLSASTSINHNNNNNNHHHTSTNSTTTRTVKKRLPLPKNVVLLSLIEATELVAEDARKKYTESPRPPNDQPDTAATLVALEPRPGVYQMHSMVDAAEEEEEEEKIKVASSIAVGVAGTYAVAVRQGLEILPHRPPRQPRATTAQQQQQQQSTLSSGNNMMDASQTSSHADEEVESLMRSMQLTHETNQATAAAAAAAATAAVQSSSASASPPANTNRKASSPSSTSSSPSSSPTHSQQAPAAQATPTPTSSTRFSPAQPNAKLSFGDRVQVVSVDAGWAKLARGYGYVPADRSQLVKVGGTVDRACALEAMLRALSDKRKELRHQQARLDNQFIRVMKDLQLSLQNDEDLTVILASAFSDVVQEDLGTTNENYYPQKQANGATDQNGNYDGSSHYSQKHPHRNHHRNTELETVSEARAEPPSPPPARVAAAAPPASSSSTLTNTPTTNTAKYYSPEIIKPNKLPDNLRAVQETKSNLSMMCFASDVFSSFDGCDTRGQDVRDTMSNSSLHSNGSNTSPREEAAPSRTLFTFFPTHSNPSPSAMRAGAQAWRERQGRPARNGIDFRTGMSGHMALLSTHAHAHRYLDEELSSANLCAPGGTLHSNQSQYAHSQYHPSNQHHSTLNPTIPRMSSHTGLSMAKNNKSSGCSGGGVMGVLASLSIPSFGSTGTTSQGTTHTHQSVPRSGSM